MNITFRMTEDKRVIRDLIKLSFVNHSILKVSDKITNEYM